LKAKDLLFALVFVLVVGSVASADYTDVSGSLTGVYTMSLAVNPDGVSNVMVVFDGMVRGQNKKVDHQGDMTAVGDYEVWEGRLSSILIGLGYRMESVTPWIGAAGQNAKTTKHEMKLQDGKLNKVTTDVSEPARGVAFGLSAEHWTDSFGLSGTVAKMPEGFMANARLKYNFSGIGTAHVGYVYDSIVGHGVVAGVGIAY